jgi:uncharacterized protein YndB with AHSA1/START domain
MRVTIRRLIFAPPEQVFAAYTDASRLNEWQPGVRGVAEKTGRLDQAGTRYVVDQPGPRLSIEVLSVDPPQLHRQLESYRWYQWVGTARFEPLQGSRTRFSYEYAPRLGGFGWLLWPAMMVMALFFMRSEFDQLKAVAETRQGIQA